MTNTHKPFALTDAIIFTGDVFVEKQAVLISDGKITDLVPNGAVPDGFEKVSCANHILTAGFIDCQVNGGGNVLFNSTPTAEGARKIAAAHRKTGTTRLLPTCITDTPEVMSTAVRAAREARKIDPSILGIHLEGPHISEEYRGTHNPAYVRRMNDEDEKLYEAQDGEVFLLTVAPEEVERERISRLTEKGVIVSLGHTIATREQVQGALKAGAKGFTHLFNRMPPIRTRNAGAAVYALDDKESYASILTDGMHLEPELIRLAVKAKNPERLFIVSDAMPPAGADDPQPFTLCGIKVFVKGNACINENDTFAGPALTLGQCVSIAIRDIRLDPERVFRMASTIPAEFLGLGDKFGKLLPGYTADVVALDHSFKATVVWQGGVRVE